jgi:hypothetical protein
MRYNEDLKSLQISEKEAKSIDAYRGLGYKLVNSILEPGLKNETEINSKLDFIPYDESSIKDAIDTIINSYSAMVKNSHKYNSNGMQLYRGTTEEEISRVNTSKEIGRFLSTTKSKEMAEGYFSVNWDSPAVIYINLHGNVPFIDMSDVVEDYGDNWEKEILLAPFTKVDGLKEISKYNGKNYYTLSISKQDLPEIDEKQRKLIYKEILEDSNKMGNKLKEYFTIEKTISDLYFKKEMLTKNLSGSGIDKEDRKYMSEELNDINKKIDDVYASSKEYEQEISEWKSKIISYCKAECKELEKNIENDAKKEQTQLKVTQEKERLTRANNMLFGIKDNCIMQVQETINMSNSIKHKLEDISYDQDEYESLANRFGLKYNKWCKFEKDKIAIEKLTNKLNEIKQKIEEYDVIIQDVDSEYPTKKSELDKLLSSNMEIHELLNNIQNKSLDLAKRIELNSFKKSIMNKFLEIKANADINKIEANQQKLNNKRGISKVIDKITGQKKVDEFKKEQIKRQRQAVQSTLNDITNDNEIDTTKKYSIHEIISKLDKYIEENKDNAKLKEEIQEMIVLRENVSQVFKINETQVKSLIGRQNLKQLVPAEEKKIDKLTKVKMDSDRWIAENGYIVKDKKDIKEELRKPEDNIEYDLEKITMHIELSLQSNLKSKQTVKIVDNNCR